jgi:hypothetical protein
MDFRVGRFLVEVFQQQHRPVALRVIRGAAQPVKSGLHPLGNVGGEMKAGVNHDPSCAQKHGGVDVGAEIGIDGAGDKWRIFRDVDGGQGVQSKADTVAVAGSPDCMGAGPVKAGDDVGAGVELDVNDTDAMLRRPGDSIFQFKLAADVDADAFERDACHPVEFARLAVRRQFASVLSHQLDEIAQAVRFNVRNRPERHAVLMPADVVVAMQTSLCHANADATALGPDKQVDDVLSVVVDQRGRQLAIEIVKPSALQWKSGTSEVVDWRGEVQPPVEPGLDSVPVGRCDIDQVPTAIQFSTDLSRWFDGCEALWRCRR